MIPSSASVETPAKRSRLLVPGRDGHATPMQTQTESLAERVELLVQESRKPLPSTASTVPRDRRNPRRIETLEHAIQEIADAAGVVTSPRDTAQLGLQAAGLESWISRPRRGLAKAHGYVSGATQDRVRSPQTDVRTRGSPRRVARGAAPPTARASSRNNLTALASLSRYLCRLSQTCNRLGKNSYKQGIGNVSLTTWSSIVIPATDAATRGGFCETDVGDLRVDRRVVVPSVLAADPTPADFKNAARDRKAVRESKGVEAFNAKYGTNKNKKNAYSKCVWGKTRPR